MHWTLQVLIAVSALCLVGNAVRAKVTGSVYTPGLAICGAWSVQQVWWWLAGGDNATLFLLCDTAIIALIFRSLPRPTEWLILALFPVEWACQAYGGGATAWWINWSAVLAQMVLGLPWPAFAPAKGLVTHGPLRVEGAI